MKSERVGEEGEMNGLAVLGLDRDLARRCAAHDPDVLRLIREADVLRGRLNAAPDRPVVQRGGELGLRLHLVEQAVVPEVHLADVHTVVQHGHEDQQRDETPGRARAAPAQGPRCQRAAHHWDWAPSTRSLTSFCRATLRPAASCGGGYSPTTVRPCFCHSDLLSRWSNSSTSTVICTCRRVTSGRWPRSEEHTSELQSRLHLVCRLLLEKKKKYQTRV